MSTGLSDKFVKKYMRLAKLIGEDQNPCYTRHIGVVIVDPVANRILGTGYNGPPRGVPHNDDDEYIEQVVWPQLSQDEKAIGMAGFDEAYDPEDDEKCKKLFASLACNGKVCPRRLVGAESGKRLELCSCAHAEANAIVNSAQNLQGAWMFCWCGVVCIECAKLIINSGIKRVYCLDTGEKEYSTGSRWALYKARVALVQVPPDWCLTDD